MTPLPPDQSDSLVSSGRAYSERDLRAAAQALAEYDDAQGPFSNAERQQFLDGWLREPYYGEPDPASEARAEVERLRALLAWALSYCPDVLPSMARGEYAERYREASIATGQKRGGS